MLAICLSVAIVLGGLLSALPIALILLPLLNFVSEAVSHQGLRGNYAMRIRWVAHRYVLRQSMDFFTNDFAGRVNGTDGTDETLFLDFASGGFFDVDIDFHGGIGGAGDDGDGVHLAAGFGPPALPHAGKGNQAAARPSGVALAAMGRVSA